MRLFLFLILLSVPVLAQAPPGFLYDEEKVPAYQLPEVKADQRVELLHLFEEHVYGEVPDFEWRRSWRRVEGPSSVFGDLGVREQWVVSPLEGLEFQVLLYRPVSPQPKPVFLAMNFYGNHTVYPDPEIVLAKGWVNKNPSLGIDGYEATEESRGARSSRWPVETILQKGYGLCTLYYGDVDPDRDNFEDGVHALVGKPGEHEWGSIAAWAWGLSRVNDMLQEHPELSQVIALGHSRLGKTALWAGAQDQRFAMVISNDSGCGGAALSRRRFGETVEVINRQFPHWFCKNFHRYGGREDELPVDQHGLMSLIYPRPLYVASASADLWADPRGEFLSAREASRFYESQGEAGLPQGDMPEPGGVLSGRVSYHLRSGRHDLTLWDWLRFMEAANRFLAN